MSTVPPRGPYSLSRTTEVLLLNGPYAVGGEDSRELRPVGHDELSVGVLKAVCNCTWLPSKIGLTERTFA
jgi:hypothetical protein